MEGRVVIDPDACLKQNPDFEKALEAYNIVLNEDFGRSCPDQLTRNINEALPINLDADIYHIIERTDDTEITFQQALLAPPTVAGFVLQSKVWAEFLVDEVKNITWDDTCFTKLAVDGVIKTTLKTLIEKHEIMRAKFRDVVERKGVGRVFLLHGPPGVGKTLTAGKPQKPQVIKADTRVETIAEHVQKPLYCATSGELGTDVSAAEVNLNRIFHLAQTWKAILLIDEADVFLAKRTASDIVRNAFVSVFLRNLEYYQGIMILTTNRRKDFDEAFESRIHVSIHYDLPDTSQRLVIWQNQLHSIQQPILSFGEENLLFLAQKYKLNGREIKNLFSTAWALVEGSGEYVQLKDIERLYRINKPREELLSRRSTEEQLLSRVNTGEKSK